MGYITGLTHDWIRTSSRVPVVSSGSLKTTDCPPSSNLKFLSDDGVEDEAKGYNLGSRCRVARGGFMSSGGKVVVVVVVVVTTVVRVAGANDNNPTELAAGPWSGPLLLRSPMVYC
jgi:hypothetical protein